MKRFKFLCILAILTVSCFAVSHTGRAGEAEDLIGDPEKTIFFIFIVIVAIMVILGVTIFKK